MRDNMANNTQYKDTLQLGWGCYSFVMTDAGEDGIDFWANNDGVGFARFRKTTGATIINFEGDFGKSLIYNFTIDYPLSYEELFESKEITVYPNPANSQFVIEGKNIDRSNIKICNQLGQQVELSSDMQPNKITFNCTSLRPGLYFVLIQDENNVHYTRKILIE